jgi:tRNA(Ile)-lysidine synthase
VRSEGGLVERLRSHYERLKPDRIGVAVSGGSDSLALLHAAVAWGVAAVEAVTVDHGLRPEAAAEAAMWARSARAGRAAHGVAVGGLGRPGQPPGPGAAEPLCADRRAGRGARTASVALGHTMDDQAETLLMRLAREAGVEGLASMRLVFEREGARFDRPFLFDRRADLRAYLEARGVTWVDDPSNEDESFGRVRARRALEVLGRSGSGRRSCSAWR